MTTLPNRAPTFAAVAAAVLLAGCADMNRTPPPPVAYNPPPPALAAMPTLDVTHYRVEFANDSARIDPNGQASVDSAARLMQGNAALVATVIGSSDPTGTDVNNMRLSRQRARAVHDALLRTGMVPEQRIVTRWIGERQAPAAADPNGRSVEIAVH